MRAIQALTGFSLRAFSVGRAVSPCIPLGLCFALLMPEIPLAVAAESSQVAVESLQSSSPASEEDEKTSLDSANIKVNFLKASVSHTEKTELTLKEVLETALEQNLNLKTSKAQTKQAIAQYQTRLAQMLPDVDFVVSRSDYNGALQIFGNTPILVNRTVQQAYLMFNFPIFKGGQDWFQLRSAKRLVEAQKATQEVSEQSVLEQSTNLFYQLKQRMSEVNIAQTQLNEIQAHLELNQIRQDMGVGTRLDVLQTQAQLAKAKQQWLSAVQTSQIAALQMNELLNFPTLVQVVPPQHEPPVKAQLVSVQQRTTEFFLEKAMQNRKELIALKKKIDALKELKKIAWSGILPSVNFQVYTGGLGPSLNDTKNTNQGIFMLDFNFKDMGLPVLTKLRENAAQIDEALYTLEAQKKSIETGVATAVLGVQNKEMLIEESQAQLDYAQQALSDATERLKVGLAKNIDVLDAETRLNEARQNHTIAIIEYNQAQVKLISAMGLASVNTLTQGVQWP